MSLWPSTVALPRDSLSMGLNCFNHYPDLPGKAANQISYHDRCGRVFDDTGSIKSMSVSNLSITPGNGTITASWTLSTNAWAALVKWRAGFGPWGILLAVNTATITGLTNGVTYTIQIVPLAAQSTPNSVSVTPVAPVTPGDPPYPSNNTGPTTTLYP